MADESQEKTEQATPRKIRKAREDGQVARSQELNSVIIISLGFATIYLFGPLMFHHIGALMRFSLSEAPNFAITPGNIHALFTDKMMTYAIIVGPILLSLAILAYAINFAQVGSMFSIKALQPKLDKLNIAKGLKRLVSKRSMVEGIRDVLKIILISIIAYYTVSGWLPDIMQLADKTIGAYAAELGKLALLLALKISGLLLVISIFDFAFQRYDMAKNLRMTKQEVREELKDTDGNPVIKSRVRQVQREMAMRRMMTDIPDADVVVTNPTHIAVALKYDTESMAAPIVLAKGQRLIAEKIKAIAKEHDIPIIENKPLARSLFKLVDVGDFIPATLYRAVAEVLAFVYRMKDTGGGRG